MIRLLLLYQTYSVVKSKTLSLESESETILRLFLIV
ncbi:hypothetical protein EDC24_2021 [Aquisalibacillus elongatus]|uniref:Uncharacterized protein n=1 Tax=Aquisalibacillus elongatus TaxID=485577 RepID=A0A3N5C6J4_9BACI|nr:hypothetical protein EDC24_2021 [Aquisalibacillus elongatus]